MEKIMFKQYDSEIKTIEEERALNVIITTKDIDRDGDIVLPEGAKLTNFKKNPVVLMSHDYRGLPIGKAKELTKTDNGITAKVIFPEEGTYPLADTVFNLYKQGFMKAWSIGFIPIKAEDIIDEDDEGKGGDRSRRGRRIKIWELLEFSACSVPSNPNALTSMIAKGINVDTLKEAGFIEIDDEDEEDEKEIILKPEETEEFIHIPVRPASGFVSDSFRTIDIDAKKGIKAVIGKLKSDPQGSTHVQKYIFDKSKGWTLASAQEWVNEHKKEYENIYVIDNNITELTAVEDKTANEIYEIVKENKELNLMVDDLREKIEDLELKVGAVLNKKNKQDLRDAQEKIQSVLDSAESTEENSLEIEDVKDSKGDDTGIDIEDNAKDDKGIDEAKLEEIIEKTFKESNKSIKEHFNKKLDYIMGRVK